MRFRLVHILLIVSISFFACSKNKSGHTGKAELYEASELALLMRSMAAEQDSFKSALLRGSENIAFPSSYVKLLEAQASEGMYIGEEYKAFASTFMTQMDSLKQSSPTDLIAKHNLVVSNCVACHEMHCGGPIDRIEKLYIRD